jgi:hypothetical protein
MADNLPDKKIQDLLKQVVDHFDREDRPVRERQIRLWKRLKYYWGGFEKIYWSEIAHDWRVFDEQSAGNNDAAYYDKPINVFRAYLESIIAALSVTVPGVTCFPDDADNPLDLSTAKAGDKICELIYRHNDVALLWLHALYIYCTEGLIAAYSYSKEDESYGTYDVPEYKESEEERNICPNCGNEINDSDEFMPEVPAMEFEGELVNQKLCPTCLEQVVPEQKRLVVSRLVGTTKKPKSRQCIEVYGGLFVKIPNYAMKQADIPYLIFAYETHYSNVIDRYPHLRDKFGGSSISRITSSYMGDAYERWGRLSTQYAGEYPLNTPTVRNAWLRPSAFCILPDENDTELLQKHYPNGAKVVLVNDQFAEAENECLDDCWTLSHNPLADYLHHDPLGLLLTSIQEITTDLTSLVLQTIEHGIPQTFADPAIVNFDQYRQTEATPGMIYPTKPTGGRNIGEGFYEVKTATLSAEVQPFASRVQEMGQLVSGALPSLFGGAAPNSSKTAAQYAMSRAQALQRLQTPWKMLTFWWKNIFGKVIPAYIKDVEEDERIVQKNETGNFVNTFVRKAELQGKIGSVELEASDQLPITWSQQKDVIMQLLQAGNPEVLAAMASPENLPLLARAIGLTDFILPGEDDRQKQYEEIQILVNSEPFPNPKFGTEGEKEEKPSVEVEPYVDNHAVEADICRQWLISDAGRLAKIENEPGYKNVLLHMQQHIEINSVIMAMATAQQQEQSGQQSSGSENGPKKNNKEKIMVKKPNGPGNQPTVQ